MNTYSITGDIVERAPECAEMSVLWLRTGFDARSDTARRIKTRYAAIPDEPWRAPTDQVLPLEPPDGLLRYLYFFSHPDDEHGYPSLDAAQDAIGRCLDRAALLKCTTVAMIHVPLSLHGRPPTDDQKAESANAMVAAMQAWDTANPNRINDVYLVDLRGAFGTLLPPRHV